MQAHFWQKGRPGGLPLLEADVELLGRALLAEEPAGGGTGAAVYPW
jgi:hypothetical protein